MLVGPLPAAAHTDRMAASYIKQAANCHCEVMQYRPFECTAVLCGLVTCSMVGRSAVRHVLWSLDASCHSQVSAFEMVLSKYAVLFQKGYYHRNVNFQSHVDHKHQQFVSGARACVDPPHLRMVFDEAVVNSIAPQAAAQNPAEPSHVCPRPSRDGPRMGTDDTPSTCHGDRQAVAAATPEAVGEDADVNAANQTKSAEHQDGRLASEEAEPGLSGSASPCNIDTADNAWHAVMQHSMQLARDTKWTHKGLQASAVS